MRETETGEGRERQRKRVKYRERKSNAYCFLTHIAAQVEISFLNLIDLLQYNTSPNTTVEINLYNQSQNIIIHNQLIQTNLCMTVVYVTSHSTNI